MLNFGLFRRALTMGAAITLISAIGVVTLEGVASAHSNVVTGSVSCQRTIASANYVVTWTVSNSWPLTETATVETATGGTTTVTPSSAAIAVTPATATFTQTLPGSTTGTDTLSVLGTWSTGFVQTPNPSGTVTLPGGCTALPPPPPPVQSISGHIYNCSSGTATTTEVTGGTLGATGPQTVATGPNPLVSTSVLAGGYTMTATPPTGYTLVACGGTSVPDTGGTSATESVTVPSGGSGVGVFYETAIVQSISGHIYNCSSGTTTTTTANTGGTLGATGQQTVVVASAPMASNSVLAGSYTMTATPPTGYTLVACGGTSAPNTAGTSATVGVNVPAGGAGAGVFYVAQVSTTGAVIPLSAPPTAVPVAVSTAPTALPVASTPPVNTPVSPTPTAVPVASTPLAFTGFNSLALLIISVVLLTTGSFLVALSRRRRRSTSR
jgi:hypothetical protein